MISSACELVVDGSVSSRGLVAAGRDERLAKKRIPFLEVSFYGK